MHAAITWLERHGVKRTRLVADSRNVAAGDVFAAYPGGSADGRRFVADAVARGASAVLAESGFEFPGIRVPLIEVPQLSHEIGIVADAFYGAPSALIPVHGVTGTNGKTTVAKWLAEAETAFGRKAGYVGTIGAGMLGCLEPADNTTPDAARLHGILSTCAANGAKSVAIEVSSHALDQRRVQGVRFNSVVFTNLTQDHLDYHHTMAAYGAAKAKLFTDYECRHRVINADDPFGASLIARQLPNTISYGLERGLVCTEILSKSSHQMQLLIRSPWGECETTLATVGRFNAYNATAVAATMFAQGKSADDVCHALGSITAAPGRMQIVSLAPSVRAPAVLVDYAHTPDALAKTLTALREATLGRLWVVFGCGGNRDRSKRPIMGEIAARGADRVIVTSDNPRGEAADAIANDIVEGIDLWMRKRVDIEIDRRRAIQFAVTHAQVNDTVLIAGKGHEDYQEIAGQRLQFSDETEARLALAARNTAPEVAYAAH